MPIRVIWDNEEKTVIQYLYEGRWTWDDFYKALNQARAMIDTVNHKVDFIVNIKSSSILPENALSRGQSIGSSPHPNQGVTIVVGANSFMQSMYNIFSKVYGKAAGNLKISFVATPEEAQAKLKERRAAEEAQKKQG